MASMTSGEIREGFLRFFEERGHRRVHSAPVVPKDDPTLFFTNAGMNQFKDIFLGLGSRDYTRAVDTQKCIRVAGKHNDLEEVGVSPWHHTFLEMLGNWSFGDYFKREAIEWAWELLTQEWGLEKERLWATVFAGDEDLGLDADDEAESLWAQCTDLPAERVLRCGAKDNFWEMGETGPCGPCSELHYYIGDDPGAQVKSAGQQGIEEGAGGYVEIWNLVFIQFNREQGGRLQPLPAKHVDTGMGFERICSILQGKSSNYETDVFRPLIDRVAELSGRDYTGDDAVAMQVIADHVRALTFAIADGAIPSNEGAGYVLRRLLRRAARYGRGLGQQDPFIYQLATTVADQMGSAFPEVVEKCSHVSLVIRAEEESFGTTLDRGLEIFERISQKGDIDGEDAFRLHDTYGFPLDLTQLMARERGLSVDVDGFGQHLEAQRQRARRGSGDRFKAVEGIGDAIAGAHSLFVGYSELETAARIVLAESDGDGTVRLFLDRTPFYAESGGQVGDRGKIVGDGFCVDVGTAVRARGGIAHVGRLSEGTGAELVGEVAAQVEASSRQAAARNHTATHLLHEALRRTLGDHVDQMGSLVTPDRLRFDFSHFAAVLPEQLAEIEGIVSERIRADLAVTASEEDIDAAKQMGARALFGEKYDQRVRVVRVADFSLELCGGIHVSSTGQIGAFDLVSEAGIAAGTRRAEALTGEGAARAARVHRDLLAQIGQLLNAAPEDLPDRVSALLAGNRELERDLTETRRQSAGQDARELARTAVEVAGIRVLASRVEVADIAALRDLADGVRENLGSGAGVLGTVLKGKVSFIAVVTDDLIEGRVLKAGDVVREVAKLAGGSGGGKAHLAQAGGRDPDKLDGALAAVSDIVRKMAAASRVDA
jgi:alanyl-tRNA synthetase